MAAALAALSAVIPAAEANAGTCGNFCNGYYGQGGWTIGRTPITEPNPKGGKPITTGMSVYVYSNSGGLSISYVDVFGSSSGDCSATATIGFTRYGKNANGTTTLIVGECIMSGPNVLAQETNDSSGTGPNGKVLLQPTEFKASGNATTIEKYLQRFATDSETVAPQGFINAVLAFSNETDGCARAQ
jgi:hypothetical protein